MSIHTFTTKTTMRDGLFGKGEIKASGLNTAITVPKELGGLGIGTHPEELLLSASAACISFTLSYFLEQKQIVYDSVAIDSHASMTHREKLSVDSISHKVCVFVEKTTSEKVQEEIRYIMDSVDENCMISNAIRGNVELTVTGDISFVKAFEKNEISHHSERMMG